MASISSSMQPLVQRFRSLMQRTASPETQLDLLHRVELLTELAHRQGAEITALTSQVAANAEGLQPMVEHVAGVARFAEAVASDVGVLAQQMASLTTGDVTRRADLHDALAWYPAWSALAPLKSEPLVSIVVPTRDRRPLLERALSSLQHQTYQHWEAIVVNDSSVDDTAEFLDRLAAKDSRFRPFLRGGHGSGRARQFGLEQAQGDVIAYLDDDNFMSPGWLRAAVESLVRSPSVDAVYGGQVRENEGGEPWLLFEPFDELRLLEGNYIDIGAFAHRPMIGLAHPADRDGLDDWQFILSVAEKHTIAAIPAIASIYLTTAHARLSLSYHHDVEEAVRSEAVRKRLADPTFVNAAVLRLSAEMPPEAQGGTLKVGINDTRALADTISVIARRHDLVRIIELGPLGRFQNLRELVQSGTGERRWLAVRPEVDQSMEIPGGRPAWWTETCAADAGAENHVVLIAAEVSASGLRVACDVMTPDGVVLVQSVDNPSRSGDGFASWHPFGDSFWIGSVAPTDFAELVSIRALLRGIPRTWVQ